MCKKRIKLHKTGKFVIMGRKNMERRLPRLPRAPLVFASLELRFSSTLSRPKLKEALKEERLFKDETDYAPYAAGYQRRGVLDSTSGKRVLFRLYTHKLRDRSLTIGEDFFMLTTLQYARFVDFSEEFYRLFEAVCPEVMRRSLRVEEIRLRYVDVVRSLDGVAVESLIEPDFFELQKRERYDALQFSFQKTCDNALIAGTLFNSGAEKTRAPEPVDPTGLAKEGFELQADDFLFDYTTSRRFAEPIALDDVRSRVDETHETAERFFLETVTDVALDLWSREK